MVMPYYFSPNFFHFIFCIFRSPLNWRTSFIHWVLFEYHCSLHNMYFLGTCKFGGAALCYELISRWPRPGASDPLVSLLLPLCPLQLHPLHYLSTELSHEYVWAQSPYCFVSLDRMHDFSKGCVLLPRGMPFGEAKCDAETWGSDGHTIGNYSYAYFPI